VIKVVKGVVNEVEGVMIAKGCRNGNAQSVGRDWLAKSGNAMRPKPQPAAE
jgi:hypothetical protein